MEKSLNNGFCEMTQDEMMSYDGGAVWEPAVALVALAGTAIVGGFMAGRQFVKDLREKF